MQKIPDGQNIRILNENKTQTCTFMILPHSPYSHPDVGSNKTLFIKPSSWSLGHNVS